MRLKRSVPYSDTARRPPPRSSDLLPRSPRARISSTSRVERVRPASSRSTSRRTAGGCSRRAASNTAGPPPSSFTASATTASSTSASSRSCLTVSAIVRSAAGESSRSASITSWRTRARAKRRSAFDGSSRHSSPRARRYSRTSSRVTREQRTHQPAATRRHPVQCARSRRDGKAVENGLRLVGGGVSGGVVTSSKALGQHIASIASTLLEVALSAQLHALDSQRHPELIAEITNEGLVLRGPVTQPVVHVQHRDIRAEPHRDVQAAPPSPRHPTPSRAAARPARTRPLSRAASSASSLIPRAARAGSLGTAAAARQSPSASPARSVRS